MGFTLQDNYDYDQVGFSLAGKEIFIKLIVFKSSLSLSSSPGSELLSYQASVVVYNGVSCLISDGGDGGDGR